MLCFLWLWLNPCLSVCAEETRWSLNCDASTSGMLEQFEFIGKLMGIAVRSKVIMPLDLSEAVWRYLTLEDQTVDPMTGMYQEAAREDRTEARIEFVKRAEAIRKVWTEVAVARR